MELESHAGPVTAAQFSPHLRRLLITSGFDGYVQLRDVTQRTPVMVACPPTGTDATAVPVAEAAWSPSRAAVFACCSEATGSLFLYDLAASTTEPHVVNLGKECR